MLFRVAIRHTIPFSPVKSSHREEVHEEEGVESRLHGGLLHIGQEVPQIHERVECLQACCQGREGPLAGRCKQDQLSGCCKQSHLLAGVADSGCQDVWIWPIVVTTSASQKQEV